MKRISLFIILLICSFSIHAQDSRWGISVAPALIATGGDIHAGVQPGIEYKIADRLYLLTEFVYRPGTGKDSSSFRDNYFRVKPELRYCFNTGHPARAIYLGLQLSYAHREWDNLRGGSYFNSKLFEDSATTFSSAHIKSPVFSTSVQFGSTLKLFGGFYLESFFGLGLRVINTNYSAVRRQDFREDR